MKLIGLSTKWDFMPENALDVDHGQSVVKNYTALWEYAKQLEDEVHLKRGVEQLQLEEIRVLNRAVQRRSFTKNKLRQVVKDIIRFVR